MSDDHPFRVREGGRVMRMISLHCASFVTSSHITHKHNSYLLCIFLMPSAAGRSCNAANSHSPMLAEKAMISSTKLKSERN